MSKFLLFPCFSGQKILTGVITTFLLVIVLTLILLLFFLIIVVILTYKELLKVVNDELFLCFGEYLGHLEKDEGDGQGESA